MPYKRHNEVNFALTAVVKLAAPCTFFFINRFKPVLSFHLSNLLAILDLPEMRLKKQMSGSHVEVW